MVDIRQEWGETRGIKNLRLELNMTFFRRYRQWGSSNRNVSQTL